jgi:hypothetical protein
MDFSHAPPEINPHTRYLAPVDDTTSNYTSPSSLSPANSEPPSKLLTVLMNLTQDIVNARPDLKRFQKDLIVLTSFNENETLHWRPSWFLQEPYAASLWTLYNPPDVVTELLPHAPLGKLVYTRRMRVPSDPPPSYIQTWEHWNRVCDLRGVPRDYLRKTHIELMRLGLPRNTQGQLTGNHPVTNYSFTAFRQLTYLQHPPHAPSTPNPNPKDTVDTFSHQTSTSHISPANSTLYLPPPHPH